MFTVHRSQNNPILAPRTDVPWEARGAFNGSPVMRGKDLVMLYRALGKPDALMSPDGLSTVGIAVSKDTGEHFQNRRQFITPEEEWEKYGCEDPRVTFFEGTYVIFYTALGGFPYGAGNIKVAAAISKDLETIDEKHLVTPFNAKAMTLFPERINGKVTVIFAAHTDEPPSHIVLAQAENLEDFWNPEFWKKWHEKLPEHIVNPLRFDNDHLEVGAQPIKTKDGWLIIYSYIQNYFGGGDRVFGIEAVLLDLKDPRNIVGRTRGPMFVPEAIYEKYGVTPDVIFPTGVILHENERLDIYYGAADTSCAKASLHLEHLLDAIVPERRKNFSVRPKENPIIEPNAAHEWENKATFNAAALKIGDTIHLLYRAMSKNNTSVFGYATTKDGVHLTARLNEPAYVPREDFEMKKGDQYSNSGCEDARLTQIDDTIYLGYTAFNGVGPWHAALSSISVDDFVAKRFNKWSTPQLVTPDPVKDKDFCIVNEKIDGEYMLIHRVDAAAQICADFVKTLDFTKSRVGRCIELLGPRPGMWDSVKVGIAGPPVKTKIGWLLIYHGISKTGTYRLGIALLDLENPSMVLMRTSDTIFEPTEPYELQGLVNKVVFSNGQVLSGDKLFVYYGGADTVLGVAEFSMEKLLDVLQPSCLHD